MSTRIRLMVLTAGMAMLLSACEEAAAPSAGPFACTPRDLPFSEDVDLTGAWRANGGGVYFVRQLGDEIVWLGMSGLNGPVGAVGEQYANVFNGTIEGRRIRGRSVDVPRGESRNTHELELELVDVQGRTQLRLTKPASGYGDREYTPCTPSR